MLHYVFVLGRFEGGVPVDGYQITNDYEVRGTVRGDTPDVTVSGYGEDDLRNRAELGDRLFSLMREASGECLTI